jgi:hypothetical protein
MGGVTALPEHVVNIANAAAMEPAADGRGDGSRIRALLPGDTCLREHPPGWAPLLSTLVLSMYEFLSADLGASAHRDGMFHLTVRPDQTITVAQSGSF